MRDKLMKMLEKKRSLSENEKNAKMDVMGEIHKLASDAMGDKLKKVSVSSDSQEGLEEGLEKAKEIIEGKEDMEPEMSEESEDKDESPEEVEEESEMSEMSEEEIDEKIKKLMEMKDRLAKGMSDGGQAQSDRAKAISESFMGALGSKK